MASSRRRSSHTETVADIEDVDIRVKRSQDGRVNFRVRVVLVLLAVGSALGLVGSYYFDMPTGPAVVVVLGLMLVAAGIFDLVRATRRTP